MGYLGFLSRDPLGRIFSKYVFLNLLNPLGLPIPSNAMEASKKLKKFPRGCAVHNYEQTPTFAPNVVRHLESDDEDS